MKSNIRLTEQERKISADMLSILLADTYTLHLKTQNFHWNVTGASFHSLHTLFEQQYKDLNNAIDEIAERIRSLGFTAPGSYIQFSKLTSIKEAAGSINAKNMIEQLLLDHECIIQVLHGMLSKINYDEVSIDLIIGRLKEHEKNVWILRSSMPNS